MHFCVHNEEPDGDEPDAEDDREPDADADLDAGLLDPDDDAEPDAGDPDSMPVASRVWTLLGRDGCLMVKVY